MRGNDQLTCTGENAMAVTSYVQAINQALSEEMERDPLTFVMGEDVVLSAFGATKGLIDKFGPQRVRNTPICLEIYLPAGLFAHYRRDSRGRAKCSRHRFSDEPA